MNVLIMDSVCLSSAQTHVTYPPAYVKTCPGLPNLESTKIINVQQSYTWQQIAELRAKVLLLMMLLDADIAITLNEILSVNVQYSAATRNQTDWSSDRQLGALTHYWRADSYFPAAAARYPIVDMP